MIYLRPFDSPKRSRKNRMAILRAYYDILLQGTLFPEKDLEKVAELIFEKMVLPKSAWVDFQRKLPKRNDQNENIESSVALIAEKTIEIWSQIHSSRLYGFLYQKIEDRIQINATNLCELLTGPMIEEWWTEKSESFLWKKAEDGKTLQNVFNYKKVDTTKLGRLTAELGADTCPYCNRIFTNTVFDDDDNSHAVLRPQIDHFKCKSDYPWFALSISNMVPACPFCNQKKSSKDELILNPYYCCAGSNISFWLNTKEKLLSDFVYLDIDDADFDGCTVDMAIIDELPDEEAYAPLLELYNDILPVILKSTTTKTTILEYTKERYRTALINSANLFRWKETYGVHVKQAFRVYQVYYLYQDAYLIASENAFNDKTKDKAADKTEDFSFLRSSFFNLSYEELRKIIYMHSPKNYLESPLSKMTFDIETELHQAYTGANTGSKKTDEHTLLAIGSTV